MNYKVTYNHAEMRCEFIRVADGAILYAHHKESYVLAFAKGFCKVHKEDFIVE